MMKYICLILFVTIAYAAPVDEKVSPNHDHEHDVVVPSVPDNVSSHPDHDHHMVVGKKLASQTVKDENDVVVSSHPVHNHVEIGDKVKQVTTRRPVVEILESGNEHQADGSYSFHYRGEDGSFREETAVVKNPGTKDQYLEVNGAYSFFDSDDKEVVVHYKADDRGFVPVGNNIPESISIAAKQNSQLPSIDDSVDDEEEVEDEEEEENVPPLKVKPN